MRPSTSAEWTYHQAVLNTAGLLGYYPLVGAKPANDAFRNRNPLPTVLGAVLGAGDMGSLPGCVKLDGTGRIGATSTGVTSQDYGDVFTLMAVIRVAAGYAPAKAAIFGRSVATGTIGMTNGALAIRPANQADIAVSTVNINDGRAHHVCGTKNGTDVHLFVDGVDRTGVVTNATCDNLNALTGIGAREFFGWGDLFTGAVAGAAMLNRPLAPSNVMYLAALALGR